MMLAALTLAQRISKLEKELDFELVVKDSPQTQSAWYLRAHPNAGKGRGHWRPSTSTPFTSHPNFKHIASITNGNNTTPHTKEEYVALAQAHQEVGKAHLKAAKNALVQGKQQLGMLHAQAAESHVQAKKLAEAGIAGVPNHQNYNVEASRALARSGYAEDAINNTKQH